MKFLSLVSFFVAYLICDIGMHPHVTYAIRGSTAEQLGLRGPSEPVADPERQRYQQRIAEVEAQLRVLGIQSAGNNPPGPMGALTAVERQTYEARIAKLEAELNNLRSSGVGPTGGPGSSSSGNSSAGPGGLPGAGGLPAGNTSSPPSGGPPPPSGNAPPPPSGGPPPPLGGAPASKTAAHVKNEILQEIKKNDLTEINLEKKGIYNALTKHIDSFKADKKTYDTLLKALKQRLFAATPPPSLLPLTLFTETF